MFDYEYSKEKLSYFLNYIQPNRYQVKEILDQGEIPVLTANKSFILGYTNDEDFFKVEDAIILFDDFTTDSKYVDFNFKIKSSALKILEKNNECNIKYVYEYLKNINYIPESHRRHWIEIFSSFKIPLLLKEEQNVISEFLSSIDILIEKQKEFIKKLKLKNYILLRNSFHINEEKETTKLINVGKIITGKTPSTSKEYYWDGNIPFITPTDMKNKKYILTKRYVSNDFLNCSYILPKESICFTSIASIGKMCKTNQLSITNQQINSIVCNESYNSDYIYYNLRYLTPKIKSMIISDGMGMINKTYFSTIKIKKAKLKEQNKVANLLSSMDKLIELNEEKLENLKKKKKYYLNEIFK